jgi:glycosyltransferase involved in cell wall biosynthesis
MSPAAKRRVLMLNYEFPPLGGGASPVSFEIANRLALSGDFDIDVVTMGFKGLPRFEEINPNLRVHRVRCLRSKKEICRPWEQLTYLVSGYFKCRQLLRRNKYDLCHCHFIIPTGVLARRLEKEFGLDYVITAHGSDVLDYNLRFKNIYPFLINSWKNILNDAKKIISPSNFLKKEILKVHQDFSAHKISVIPNGIDVNKHEPQEKKNYIFSSGRLLVNKGFQHLIKAVSDEDVGYEVHIAGDGPMMSELQALAKESKTKIVLHGWMNNKSQEYKDLLEKAAIFVLASEKENASVVLLEAMSAGCAVITTNSSGCAETVGEAGMLTEPHDTAALAEKIKSLVKDDALRTDFQAASRKKAAEVFDWILVIEAYRQSLSKLGKI